MADATAVHNAALKPALDAIIKPVVSNGGSIGDVMVLLESVITGALQFVAPESVPLQHALLDELHNAVHLRVNEAADAGNATSPASGSTLQ